MNTTATPTDDNTDHVCRWCAQVILLDPDETTATTDVWYHWKSGRKTCGK